MIYILPFIKSSKRELIKVTLILLVHSYTQSNTLSYPYQAMSLRMSKSPQVKTFRVAETPFLLLRRRVPLPPGKPRTAAALKGIVLGDDASTTRFEPYRTIHPCTLSPRCVIEFLSKQTLFIFLHYFVT